MTEGGEEAMFAVALDPPVGRFVMVINYSI
jgi:hypothetical protein